MKHYYFSLGCLPDKTAFKTVTRSISIIIIMAIQTFNIDKSMVTCNLLHYCRSISVKKNKKQKQKQPDSTRFCHILFSDRALGGFLGHNLFDPITFYKIIVFSRFCFVILFWVKFLFSNKSLTFSKSLQHQEQKLAKRKLGKIFRRSLT